MFPRKFLQNGLTVCTVEVNAEETHPFLLYSVQSSSFSVSICKLYSNISPAQYVRLYAYYADLRGLGRESSL
jgi:hypothetical protein